MGPFSDCHLSGRAVAGLLCAVYPRRRAGRPLKVYPSPPLLDFAPDECLPFSGLPENGKPGVPPEAKLPLLFPVPKPESLRRCCHRRGGLLPRRFTLAGAALRRPFRGLLSVALSVKKPNIFGLPLGLRFSARELPGIMPCGARTFLRVILKKYYTTAVWFIVKNHSS